MSPLPELPESAIQRSCVDLLLNYERHIYRTPGAQFETLSDAADYFGVSRQTILNRCKSERWPEWSKSVERR